MCNFGVVGVVGSVSQPPEKLDVTGSKLNVKWLMLVVNPESWKCFTAAGKVGRNWVGVGSKVPEVDSKSRKLDVFRNRLKSWT